MDDSLTVYILETCKYIERIRLKLPLIHNRCEPLDVYKKTRIFLHLLFYPENNWHHCNIPLKVQILVHFLCSRRVLPHSHGVTENEWCTRYARTNAGSS
jgi:hypothetical protein